jgi:hypothetical protein
MFPRSAKCSISRIIYGFASHHENIPAAPPVRKSDGLYHDIFLNSKEYTNVLAYDFLLSTILRPYTSLGSHNQSKDKHCRCPAVSASFE